MTGGILSLHIYVGKVTLYSATAAAAVCVCVIFDLASSGLGIEPVNVQLNLGIALLSLWCLSLG